MSTTNPQVDPNQNPNPAPILDPAEIDKARNDARIAKEEADRLRQQIEDMKVAGHKSSNDWKSVAEHHETQAKEYKTKFDGLQQALVNEKKISALRAEAMKAGINSASLPDLELLDFDEVSIETTSKGQILVSGQDRAIAKLKTLRPHWFDNSVPGVNPSTPNLGKPNNQTVTLADLNAAEAQWKKTKSDSDQKIYQELIHKYKAQGRS